MNSHLKSPRTWLSAFLLLAGALLAWCAFQQWSDLAAVQDAAERNWEVNFNSTERPATLPEFIDAALYRYLHRKYDNKPGKGPRHTELQGYIYHQRFRAMLRGPIRKIGIYYPEGFRGDLGAALQRFPRLQHFTLVAGMPEADCKLLCARLRDFPNLGELELTGVSVTDAALAPLAGHPRLRSITVIGGDLTAECTKTFASLPSLRNLELRNVDSDGKEWPTQEIMEAMRAALPSVSITAP